MSELVIDNDRLSEIVNKIYQLRLTDFDFYFSAPAFLVGGAARYATGKCSFYNDIDIAFQVPYIGRFDYIKDRIKTLHLRDIELIDKNEHSKNGGKGVKNLCAQEPPEADQYYFDDHEMSGMKFRHNGKRIDLFAVRCIRKYVKTVPTAWDGIALYLRDTKHFVHSVEYLAEQNHMIIDRPMYLFNPEHIKKQGLKYPVPIQA